MLYRRYGFQYDRHHIQGDQGDQKDIEPPAEASPVGRYGEYVVKSFSHDLNKL